MAWTENKDIIIHNYNSWLDESFSVGNWKIEDKDRIISSEELEKFVEQREIIIQETMQETRWLILMKRYYREKNGENLENIKKQIIQNYEDNPNNETSNFYIAFFYFEEKNQDRMLYYSWKSINYWNKHKKDVYDLIEDYFVELTNIFLDNPDKIENNEKLKKINDYWLSWIYKEFLNRQMNIKKLNEDIITITKKIIINLK